MNGANLLIKCDNYGNPRCYSLLHMSTRRRDSLTALSYFYVRLSIIMDRSMAKCRERKKHLEVVRQA